MNGNLSYMGEKVDKLEPVVLLLFAGIVISLVALFAAEKMFPMDGQMFQVVAGVLTTFMGALMMRVKPKGPDTAKDALPPTGTSTDQPTS